MLPPATHARAAADLHPGAVPRERAVAAEVPVNLVYGGVPHAVMMATPDDLEDFALGFSVTEGIVAAAVDIRGIAIEPHPAGIVLNVSLVPNALRRHLARGLYHPRRSAGRYHGRLQARPAIDQPAAG